MIGQTLSHYSIIEEIGRGGMGVVYRARDSRLQRDVALKVLPARKLSNPEARRRFRNEALALGRLNHPNICSVFDFDSEGDVDFLVMEYVPGMSLDKRLAQGGLPLEEVPRLGAQLASGLATAHEQGVIHRDLKPGNLRVTPDGRLKILDFGLAKAFHPEEGADATQSMADTSSFSGTIPYMAPEQLKEGALDTRTDIYSAGAVLYEMALGRRCFAEPQLARLIDSILNTPPRRPTELNRRVSPALESILLKALDKKPDRRYQSARELTVDLERLAAGQAPLEKLRTGVSWRAAAVTTVFLLLVGAAAGWHFVRRGRPDSSASDSARAGRVVRVPQRRSVAVLGFKNMSGNPEAAWLSTGLSEMLSTELAAGERLRTVSGENVSRVKRELALMDTDSYAKDTLDRIRVSLSSDAIVFGSYVVVGSAAGKKIRIDLRVQDTNTGQTVAAVSETGDESDLLEVVARAGEKLRTALGAPQLTNQDTTQARAAMPQSTQAARLYSEGLDKLRRFEGGAAKDLLERAAATDPSSAVIHVALATAWGQLGYDQRALEEAKKSFDLSSQLSREERLSVEGRYYEAGHNWPKAVDVYKSLSTFFPDNADYALRLANAQGYAGQTEASLATLQQLRATLPEMNDDPRVDITEASTADHLSDFKHEQAASHSAVDKAKRRGESLTTARGLLLEGWAWHNLGDSKKSLALSLEAKTIYEAAGDRVGVARALHNLGIVAMDQGQLDEAEKDFNAALAIRRPMQDNQGINRAVANLGRLCEMRGDLKCARKFYEESLAVAREISDRPSIGNALGNLANVYLSEGRPAEARRYMNESLLVNREIDNKVGVAADLANLGSLEINAGNVAEARKFYEESAAKFEEAGQKSGMAQVRVLLASLLYEQGDRVAAKASYEQALTSAKEIGDPSTASDAEAGLSNVERVNGDWNAARTHAENAVASARAGGDKKLIAGALFALVGVLEGQGDLAGAQKAADEGLATARESGDKDLIATGVYDAAVQAYYSGDFPRAQKAYEEALALHQETKNLGAVGETQVALAEMAIEQKQAARASDLAQQASTSLHQLKNAHLEARAALMLGRAALQLGKSESARKWFAQAAGLEPENGDSDQRLLLAAWSARATAPGVRAETLKKLQAQLAELGAKAGLNAQFEARLAVAELTLASGSTADAQAQLKALEKDASAKNFSYMARRAAAALR